MCVISVDKVFHLRACLSNTRSPTGVQSHCMVKDCIRSFKNTGDLNRHVNQHTGIWYNCDFCTYRNKDKWNRVSHQHMHVDGNEKYSCIHSGKKFKFDNQFKWHQVGGCELPVPEPDRSNSPEF